MSIIFAVLPLRAICAWILEEWLCQRTKPLRFIQVVNNRSPHESLAPSVGGLGCLKQIGFISGNFGFDTGG